MWTECTGDLESRYIERALKRDAYARSYAAALFTTLLDIPFPKNRKRLWKRPLEIRVKDETRRSRRREAETARKAQRAQLLAALGREVGERLVPQLWARFCASAEQGDDAARYASARLRCAVLARSQRPDRHRDAFFSLIIIIFLKKSWNLANKRLVLDESRGE